MFTHAERQGILRKEAKEGQGAEGERKVLNISLEKDAGDTQTEGKIVKEEYISN